MVILAAGLVLGQQSKSSTKFVAFAYNSRIQTVLQALAAIYNNWTGLVDWAGGLTKRIPYIPDETHMPVGLHDASYFPQSSLILGQTDLCNNIF